MIPGAILYPVCGRAVTAYTSPRGAGIFVNISRRSFDISIHNVFDLEFRLRMIRRVSRLSPSPTQNFFHTLILTGLAINGVVEGTLPNPHHMVVGETVSGEHQAAGGSGSLP